MLRHTLLLAAVSAVGLAVPAHAHSAWLLPSITVVADTNQSVTVDAGTSTAPFEANHAAMNVDKVKVWAPDGSMGKVENPARGRYRSTFDVRIDKPGTWRVGVANVGVSGTFKVNGEAWRLGRSRGGGGAPGGPGAGGAGASGPGAPGGAAPRAQQAGTPGGRPMIDAAHTVATIAEIPAGATDLELTETSSRNEFFVTAGEPTDTVLRPTNKGLEFVPVTLPTDLVSNEPGKFRFLIDGKPAAGLKVEVTPGGRRFREADGAQEFTADANGEVIVKWPIAGFYYLTASAQDNKPTEARATKRRMSYVATLEVLAP